MTALLLLLRALECIAFVLVWAAVIWLIRLAILKLIGLIDKRKEYWDVESLDEAEILARKYEKESKKGDR